MKIGLLIPTRERLNNKFNLIVSIIATVKNINNINIYFGVDDDDPMKDITYKIAQAIPCVKIIPIHNDGKYIGINRIWNILAKECKDDIFGYIGDDMVFKTNNWDEIILNEFQDNCPKDNIKLVHCWDGWHGDKLCVNAFIHRQYYDLVGYLCREEFLVDWSDQWLFQMFSSFNRVTYIKDIFIEHNHWTYNKSVKDKISERMTSNNNSQKSMQLWPVLGNERDKEAKLISNYLKIEPNWSKIENIYRK